MEGANGERVIEEGMNKMELEKPEEEQKIQSEIVVDRPITVVTSDDERMVLDVSLIKKCDPLKNMHDFSGADFPVVSIKHSILEGIMKYSKLEDENAKTDPKREEIKIDRDRYTLRDWETELYKSLKVYDVMEEWANACNFLNYRAPLNSVLKYIAENFFRGRSIEEIRETFHEPDDISPEDKERIEKEMAWANELTN